MKRKTITLVIYMLVCISLVSVGFAAWVITGGDNTQATGNVQASVVTDSSIVIDDSVGFGGNNSIMFGSPNVSARTDAYLTFNGDDKENLSVVYQFTVSSNSGDLADIKTLTATYSVSEEDDKGEPTIQSLIDEDYISDVSFSCTVGVTDVKFSGNNNTSDPAALADGLKAALNALGDTTDGSATVKITIAYSWGSAFDGVNPYYYYNFLDYKADKDSDGDGILYENLRSEFPATPTPDGESWSEKKDHAWTALHALELALAKVDNNETQYNDTKPFSLVINISSRAQ